MDHGLENLARVREQQWNISTTERKASKEEGSFAYKDPGYQQIILFLMDCYI